LAECFAFRPIAVGLETDIGWRIGPIFRCTALLDKGDAQVVDVDVTLVFAVILDLHLDAPSG
jgi:hypothetical protein